MPPEYSSDVKFEIGHVLFIDIVGYSKLLINQQSEQIQTLKKIVRGTEQCRIAEAEGKLLRLPTGDGGALVFRNSPEAPVLCALEISKELKNHPELQVRMGIHSGPVNEVTDLNEQANVAGAGINIAQRVMDCGDAGHILVSKRVADDLEQYVQWRSLLHDLGECEVKHGLRISILNLYDADTGNAELPEKFRQAKGQTAPGAAASDAHARHDEGLWLAVLPFKSSGDAEMESFANGLGEDITTGLSRFRYLSVVASASAARLKGEPGDERTLGAKLGARYVLEGSIRRGGAGIRVSAQLVDTQTGAQFWAETYNRDLQASSIFAAQDDVAAHIVATVADSYGVLVHSMRDAIRQKDDADLTPVEWQFQYFAYREQITPSNHAALKGRLQRAVKQDDRQSDLCACLAQIYVDEYAFGWQDDATSLDRALAAARRGVELDRANQFAMVALAQTHFFRQDLAAFGPAAERAMALNPLNTDALGILGLQIVHTAEFERGTAIVRRAMELNANHAGWMHFAPLWDHFHKGEYEQALECANRVDVPGLFWPFLVMASACGHLGRRTEAAAAVRDLLALDPDFAAHARSNIGTWHFASGLMDSILEGLRKAGLAIADNDDSSDSPRRIAPVTSRAEPAERRVSARSFPASRLAWLGAVVLATAGIIWWFAHQSGKQAVSSPSVSTSHAVDQKSIAVLPFANLSADKNDEYLSDGMTEELLNVLTKVKGLRVPGRSASFAFKGKTEDNIFRKVGEQLHVNAVLEGSVRKAGDKLRITAQLINVADGFHLWSETYDGDMKDILAMQSDVAQRVVRALQVQLGVDEARALTKKPTENAEAYRLYLLGRYHFAKFTRIGWTNAIHYFEQALQVDPNYALAYCGLADTYGWAGGQTLPGREAWAKAKDLAQKALALDPNLAEAHLSLGVAFFSALDLDASEKELERAVELNPNLALAYDQYGWTYMAGGRFDEAIAKEKKALELDSLNILFNTDLGFFLSWARRYDEAIVQLRKTLELDANNPLARQTLGWCLHWKGKKAEAVVEFQKTAALDDLPWYKGSLGYAYAASGDRAKAEQVLRDLDEMAKKQYVSPASRASVYLGLGDKAKALDWIEKAGEDRDPLLWWNADQLYDSVRNEPRFKAMMQKIAGGKQ
jgi:adenylate cyclase